MSLTVLGLGIAGVAKVAEMSFSHSAVTRDYQAIAHTADGHLNSLTMITEQSQIALNGRYHNRYRWQLTLTPVTATTVNASNPSGIAIAQLNPKTRPFRADLTVWYDDDRRALEFHRLILLANPSQEDAG